VEALAFRPAMSPRSGVRVIAGGGGPSFLWRPGTPGIAVKMERAPDGARRITLPAANQLSVYSFIKQQEEHHRKRTFQEEYLEFLQESGISYDERYLW